MSKTCRVAISLDVGEKEALDLCDILGPDNVDIPKGLSIRMRAAGETIMIDVYSEKSVAQVTGTVDEILSHTQVALDVTNHEGVAR